LEAPLDVLKRRLSPGEGPPRLDASAQVDRLEERCGARMPEDFRAYLLQVAPATDLMDDQLTLWWGIDHVQNLADELPDLSGIAHAGIRDEGGAYLLFADYMIWAWAWAVCCSWGPNRGRVAIIGGSPDGFVAQSFSEFVSRYLRDPDEMTGAQPPPWREGDHRWQ
jgi:hypothetical protein